MTKKNNQVTYKTKVKREFYRIRQICVKKMYERDGKLMLNISFIPIY